MSWLDRGKWVSGKKVHYQSDVGALIWKANRLDPVGLSRARWRDQACSVCSLWVLFPFRGKVDVNKRGSLIYLASISGCSVCGGRGQWWVRHSSDLEKALIRGRLAEGAALSCVRPPTEIAVGTFAASTSQFPTELSGIIYLLHGVCAAEVAWIHWLWYAATQSPESESAVSPLWAVLFLFIFCLWWGWGVRHVREGGKKRETKNWWGWGGGEGSLNWRRSWSFVCAQSWGWLSSAEMSRAMSLRGPEWLGELFLNGIYFVYLLIKITYAQCRTLGTWKMLISYHENVRTEWDNI